MRVLVTGGTGQVGRAVREVLDEEEDEGVFTVRGTPGDQEVRMDLEDPTQVREVVHDLEPDWVVHAAAMTNVDACEEDPEKAHRVNVEGTRVLAEAASKQGARVVYVSTDQVFDGRNGPYSEEDGPGPVNTYARTKLAGEETIQDILDDPIIARTCVVYGPHRDNFVQWALDRLKNGKTVPSAVDQTITPTYSLDLANQLCALIQADARGIYHTVGQSALTRVEMVEHIADIFDLDAGLIEPVKREDIPWVAPRPQDTRLTCEKIATLQEPMTLTQGLNAYKNATS